MKIPNKTPIIITAIFTLFAVTLSCKKKLDFPNQLYITQAMNSSLMTLTMDNGTGSVTLTAAMAYKSADAVQATFSVLDSNFLNEYNRKNHTEFKAVPRTAVHLSSDQINIAPNQVFSNAVDVTINKWIDYTAGVQYVVPINISNASNGMGIIEGSDVVLIRINQISVSSAALNSQFSTMEGGPLMGADAKGKTFNTVTIEGRFKYDNNFVVSGNWRSDFFIGYGMQVISSGNGSIDIRFPDASFMGAVGKRSLNTWYHFAAVNDNGNISLYLDGELMVQTVYTGLTESGGVSIAGYATGCGLTVDEFRVWKTARTKNQIKEYMCEVNPKDPNLLAYWKFDETSGKRTEDVSGHGHALISSTTPTWVPGVRCPL